MLPFPHRRVVRPVRHRRVLQKVKRLQLNVAVPAVDVRERVVHVVLVLPPLRAEAVGEGAEVPHHAAPLPAAVDVVVRQPPGLLHAQT